MELHSRQFLLLKQYVYAGLLLPAAAAQCLADGIDPSMRKNLATQMKNLRVATLGNE